MKSPIPRAIQQIREISSRGLTDYASDFDRAQFAEAEKFLDLSHEDQEAAIAEAIAGSVDAPYFLGEFYLNQKLMESYSSLSLLVHKFRETVADMMERKVPGADHFYECYEFNQIVEFVFHIGSTAELKHTMHNMAECFADRDAFADSFNY